MLSPSVWRAWIEMRLSDAANKPFESPSVWRAWIEIPTPRGISTNTASPSVWRAWIEMRSNDFWLLHLLVALRMEGVD